MPCDVMYVAGACEWTHARRAWIWSGLVWSGPQAMLLPGFPFNILGAVLARNEARLERAVQPGEKLLYR